LPWDFEKKHDRPAEEVLNILKEAQFQQDIIEKISRPAEGTMTWKRYRNIFIKQERIDAGLAFWEEHKAAITSISSSTEYHLKYC
jgi:membrane-bound lytic murein transglycosylase B